MGMPDRVKDIQLVYRTFNIDLHQKNLSKIIIRSQNQ